MFARNPHGIPRGALLGLYITAQLGKSPTEYRGGCGRTSV
jgi:hypothetical protein